MARFRATIHGARGPASRLGGAKSGISATVNGWKIGVAVEAFVMDADADCIVVSVTGGSNGDGQTRPVCRITRDKDGRPEIELIPIPGKKG